MKLQLLIEGSASTLAMILANLPADALVSVPGPSGGNAPGAGAPPTPQPAPIPPMPAAPTGGDDDDGPVMPVADGAVDVNGLPWDERIHAKTKATNADGSWRYRRGVDDATKAAVEAELRSRNAPPMPAAVAPPAPIPAPVPMPTMAPPAPLPVAAPMPPVAPVGMETPVAAAAPVPSPAPPMPVPTPQPAPAPVSEPIANAVATATGPLDFAQFMQHLSHQMTQRDANGAPLIHADYLAGITNEIATAYNVQLSAITDIAAQPHMIQYAVQLMQRDQRW